MWHKIQLGSAFVAMMVIGSVIGIEAVAARNGSTLWRAPVGLAIAIAGLVCLARLVTGRMHAQDPPD